MAETLRAFNLNKWIDDHRDLLKPPVGAEMIWKDSQFIVMVIGGPNARRDFHIDPSDEFFYQLRGNMVLEYISREGKRLHETIREGEILMLPANVPHSPQRPSDTIGLVIERARQTDEGEGYSWYCERCDARIYDMPRVKPDILVDLKDVTAAFNADETLRKCGKCGYVQPVAAGPRL